MLTAFRDYKTKPQPLTFYVADEAEYAGALDAIMAFQQCTTRELIYAKENATLTEATTKKTKDDSKTNNSDGQQIQ